MARDGSRASLPRHILLHDTLFERIQSGNLRPGEQLASNYELAAELGYSQGAVQKALHLLCEEKLLAQQEGGRFVVLQPLKDLFRFFNIYTDDGRKVAPESRSATMLVMPATEMEITRLGLRNDASVLRIQRVRTHDGRPFITEKIVLPQELFPELEWTRPLPNVLYGIFESKFGVTVAQVDERLAVVCATARDAKALNVEVGTPLLAIDRTAISIKQKIVEWRVSHVHMAGYHYRAEVC
jgi:GntR family transcriptional regulator